MLIIRAIVHLKDLSFVDYHLNRCNICREIEISPSLILLDCSSVQSLLMKHTQWV